MKHQEAKFILGAYRPDGRDATDPAFAEALAHARHDPELGRWFERERQFDATVAAKFGAIAPPAGLRESILAGARLSAARAARPWWRSPAWLGAAAAIVLVAASWLTLSLRSSPLGEAELLSFALRDLAEAHAAHVGHPPGLASVQSRFAGLAAPLAGTLRLDAAELRRHGCRTVNFRGREIFEFCVEREGTWFHVYAARRTDFGAGHPANPRLIASQGRLAGSVWTDGDMVYAIAAETTGDALRRLI